MADGSGSREQGAGSREQGAGSREQGQFKGILLKTIVKSRKIILILKKATGRGLRGFSRLQGLSCP